MASINRYSSRRSRLDHSFLRQRLQGARSYDRIAGYFNSSLLELVGEQLEGMRGHIRVVCNSELKPIDVRTARAAAVGMWKSWATSAPESPPG